MDEPNFYAIIPASVRYDKSLKPNAKLLYGEITALTGKEGFCWADNEYFGALYEVDHKTVSRWISQLRNSGHIEVEILHKEGNKRRITIDKIVTRSCQKSHEVVTKKSRGSDEKSTPIKESITINNTINRDVTALEFLASNFPSRYEAWMMQNKSKIGSDFQAFCDDFNCKVVEEKKEWECDVLFARLTRLANNWNRNDLKKAAAVQEVPAGPKRVIFTGN